MQRASRPEWGKLGLIGFSDAWHSLKDLKESHLLQVAEHAVNNELLEEPAFAWWAKKALKTQERIIGKMKSRYVRREQKHRLQLVRRPLTHAHGQRPCATVV